MRIVVRGPLARKVGQEQLRTARHTGLLGTWSTSRTHVLAWFPIDHVLSTPDIGLVSIRRGPDLGSDHLPVIATLRLPGI